uniref:Retrotransposon gag domain-containing protein n=1 Tax=Caenorhabditis japonica TaxID=281687 RepID=A0A8R1EEX0_CAEJA
MKITAVNLSLKVKQSLTTIPIRETEIDMKTWSEITSQQRQKRRQTQLQFEATRNVKGNLPLSLKPKNSELLYRTSALAVQQRSVETLNPTDSVHYATSAAENSLAEEHEEARESQAPHIPRVCVLGFKSTTSIGTYSGAFSESLSLFVRQFKDQMKAADAEASETAQVYAFLTFLVGNARDRAEEFLDGNANATVDQLVADLKATQERGESIEKYFNRVRILAAQAFRCENKQVIEKKARDAFLNGLEDTIRYNVKDKDPKTCKQALDEAIRQEILREDRLAAQQYAPTVALLDEMRSFKNDWFNAQANSRMQNNQ